MRHPSFGLFVTLLTVGLVAACAESEPESPVFPEMQSAVAPSSTGGQGAIVEVDQTAVFFFHFDAKRNLLSAHLPSDFCLTGELNVADRRIVTTPSEIEQRFVQIKDGDSRVAVYRASSLNDLFSDFCGFLLGPNRIAEGTVRHTQTFSNASFAAHWGGKIEAVDGGTLQLSESYQLTASAHEPNNPATWSVNASHIHLNGGG